MSMRGFEKVSRNEMKTLATDVVRLSRLLTSEREDLPSAYLKDEGLRKAYRAYFLPSNLSKIHKPLQELTFHPRDLLSKAKLRILDIGAGPGTALLGVLTFFSQQEQKKPQLDFTAVDQVGGNLKIAEELFSSSRSTHKLDASLKTLRAGIEGLGNLLHGHFDVIILSNVMNELFAGDERRTEKRVSVLDTILKKFLADDGSCILIEPALRETSREMLEVRDGLLEKGFRVYSPCFFIGKCPALANPKDWCHEDIPWDPPALVKEIDKLTGLRKDSLKFSYLVLRKDGLSLSDVCGLNSFRVVSDPLVSKGKRELYVCGPGGRRLVTRLDKDATPGNEHYEALKRGDCVRFEGLIDEEKRFKIGKETALTCTGGVHRNGNCKT
jgi:ribosomal protein RSM22 (predicted rRNA methylase)